MYARVFSPAFSRALSPGFTLKAATWYSIENERIKKSEEIKQ